jgi:isocitrate dehydrogenase kinase/phosphatase
MPCQVLRPHFDQTDWQNVQERLTNILQYYEEVPSIGTRFLVERIDKHQLVGDINVTIHHDYILLRTFYGWEPHLSIWSNEPPYTYDFDIFQLRPVERLRG